MQTRFTLQQLQDPDLREAEKILRACVHCGFCLATCPTYLELGDELDSPRGRIYLIKDMLENGKPASSQVARHVDRCLSCLGCMTTCPSGVNYMHLVDYARVRIEETRRRPWTERALRAMLALVLPRPVLFRPAVRLARFARPLARLLPARLKALVALAPAALPPPAPGNRPQRFPAQGSRKMRVALLPGCVQTVLAPQINAATVRVLTRHGVEVVVPEGVGCCGALVHHLGRRDAALGNARANVAAWSRLVEQEGIEAIVVNAAGCGTMVKDYGYLLRDDPVFADRAARISELACDVAEIAGKIGIGAAKPPRPLTVAYHSACSLQHGQKLHDVGKNLLAAAGFETRDIPDGHLCCGSAGTYNLLEPEMAAVLAARKAAAIESVAPDVVATGNIGCIVQIGRALTRPVVHTVELLDWATGGPCPPALSREKDRIAR
ncbi:MAG TPA: glycolate oxidase subunit GlcF [Alphaproteobacteria bacterium]|nr:glycolate oxidase subunit GlcF [Alphaproteobacteria bacterium]